MHEDQHGPPYDTLMIQVKKGLPLFRKCPLAWCPQLEVLPQLIAVDARLFMRAGRAANLKDRLCKVSEHR